MWGVVAWLKSHVRSIESLAPQVEWLSQPLTLTLIGKMTSCWEPIIFSINNSSMDSLFCRAKLKWFIFSVGSQWRSSRTIDRQILFTFTVARNLGNSYGNLWELVLAMIQWIYLINLQVKNGHSKNLRGGMITWTMILQEVYRIFDDR